MLDPVCVKFAHTAEDDKTINFYKFNSVNLP